MNAVKQLSVFVITVVWFFLVTSSIWILSLKTFSQNWCDGAAIALTMCLIMFVVVGILLISEHWND